MSPAVELVDGEDDDGETGEVEETMTTGSAEGDEKPTSARASSGVGDDDEVKDDRSSFDEDNSRWPTGLSVCEFEPHSEVLLLEVVGELRSNDDVVDDEDDGTSTLLLATLAPSMLPNGDDEAGNADDDDEADDEINSSA